ncbi:MAG: helix-turn-helix domain-containing protein [Lachnospiraceae bacterium]|nr:helix-turn-helix domain-containing protein [Lachnospiraceae bacterium]
MISNQILQNTIDGLTGIAHVPMVVTDANGRCVVSTENAKQDFTKEVEGFVNSPADSQEIGKKLFFKIFDEQQLEYILVMGSSGENAHVIGKMAAFQLEALLVAYKERFDKDNFIKNLLLDNLLLVDIYSRAKKLHMQIDLPRVVFIARANESKEVNMTDMVKDYLSHGNNNEIVTAVDESSVIIVKELDGKPALSDLSKEAEQIVKHLEKQNLHGVRIAIGTIVHEIKEVSRSYKEAKMALDVGKIFFEDKPIIAYSELGIGRLIYQLPLPLCKMFIREIFGDKNPDDFDEETITTINKFFENSLNVSETSRQLYIHRNTLVYRLDKLQKNTGLDLRVFEDAITFHIALMVVKYMNNMENMEF